MLNTSCTPQAVKCNERVNYHERKKPTIKKLLILILVLSPSILTLSQCQAPSPETRKPGPQSRDPGLQRWQKTNGPFNTERMYDLEMSPIDHHVIFAGTNRGIYRTIDGAVSWHELTNGFSPDYGILGIEIDPDNSRVIYAINHYNIYKSTNGGDLWKKLTPSVADEMFGLRTLEIDPGNPDVLYAGGVNHITRARTIWQTTDGGVNWHAIYSLERGEEHPFYQIECITVSPHDLKTYAVEENVTIGTTRFIKQAAISEDDRYIFFSDTDLNRIHVFDTRTNALADTIPTDVPTATVTVNKTP